MARAPLLQLSQVSLTFGGNPLFDGLDLVVQPGDRLALVGRNGSGKSTLMKLMAGLVEPDRGARTLSPGTRVAYMEQDPDLSGHATLGDFVASGIPEDQHWRIAAMAEGLDFRPETPVATASGGERRRAALARLMADAPDLMLLDEPTNHLDIESREALVEALTAYPGAVVLVSHDMHLVGLVADRLWLVKGGRVAPWESDLEAYRRMLLIEEEPAQAKAAPNSAERNGAKASRDELLALKAEVRRAEERMAKLSEMRGKLQERLADPLLYEPARLGELEGWNRKFAELEEAERRAETLWLEAAERLEAAGG